MTPEKAKEAIVTLTTETSEQLAVEGWERDSAPWPAPCTIAGRPGVVFDYGLGAPPGTNRQTDAETVAQFWEEQGLTVRLTSHQQAVVYGEEGPASAVMFSTAPGDYNISGSSACIPGHINEVIENEVG